MYDMPHALPPHAYFHIPSVTLGSTEKSNPASVGSRHRRSDVSSPFSPQPPNAASPAGEMIIPEEDPPSSRSNSATATTPRRGGPPLCQRRRTVAPGPSRPPLLPIDANAVLSGISQRRREKQEARGDPDFVTIRTQIDGSLFKEEISSFIEHYDTYEGEDQAEV
ncbi:hypothetical protein PG994_008081 [Apiospora phragmitis]|uniref:Uncharacterized protein n=1 Tax=Apiospora phragmitis TaxID=2905665 RepID=A0ABR1UUI7_9PEZI